MDDMTTRRAARLGVAAAALALGLAGCGGGGDAGAGATAGGAAGATADGADAPSAKPMTLAEGPDVCFRAVARHLGPDAKVAEVLSFFSVGQAIDGDADTPAGQATLCQVQYQNPRDARKLLSTRLDLDTGVFTDPVPVEISLSAGDATSFKLDDILIPLSRVHPEALSAVMAAQAPKLDAVFARHAWSGVRLDSPGAFDNEHTLRLDVEGRLASNDIKESGYAALKVDGTTIIRNLLLP